MAEPGSAEAHLQWLRDKQYRQWLVLADATSDLTEVTQDDDGVAHALLDGRAVVGEIRYVE